MFNSIQADLVCPTTGSLSVDSEIQIKWQDREARVLAVYHVGDLLEDLEPGYDGAWVRTNYICNACSPRTASSGGGGYHIRREDERWHVAFVELVDSRLVRILAEREFLALGVSRFVDDIWVPPAI
jgi:hypothetical protein